MKKYEKPSLDIIQLTVKENIAANPAGVTGVEGDTYVTTYNLKTYNSPQGS